MPYTNDVTFPQNALSQRFQFHHPKAIEDKPFRQGPLI